MNNADHTYTLPTGFTTITKSMLDEIRVQKHITHVIIPESVTSIGEGAFSECKSLASVTIPDSVTSIDDSPFYGCKSLTTINIPYSITSIGIGAFAECESLTTINIPESVTSIGKNAFVRCKSLTSVTIPDRVTSIGSWAFRFCSSLTTINIPERVTSIGKHTFLGCTSLTTIDIPESVSSISLYAFVNCISLRYAIIPRNLEGKNASYWTDRGIDLKQTTLITQNQLSNWAKNNTLRKNCSSHELAVLYQLQKDDSFNPSWPELGKLAPNLLMGDLIKGLPEKKTNKVLPKIYTHRPITQCLDKLSLFSVTPLESRQEESDYLKKEGFQEYKNSHEPNKTVQLGEVDPAASSAILKSLTLKEVATLLSLKASSELRPTDASKDDHLTANKTKAVMQG